MNNISEISTLLNEHDDWQLECQEWIDALDDILRDNTPEQAKQIIQLLQNHMLDQGHEPDTNSLNTPYKNSIPISSQPAYPGNIDIEKTIENIIRWNAMAMVLKANDLSPGIGGHIATYFSAATMIEVGMNHIFRKRSENYGGDIVNIQAHASPGMYARAYLEGRLSEQQLVNFRRELQPAGGLSSYPHPRRMPEFWQMPTASMGLSTPSSIYQARFAKYLENRGLKQKNGGKVWTFIGDGESDEPEVLGTINIAAREKLDNLVLVVNCNLQRLDGPVRGNGKIIQELEKSFRASGWHVIKVIWSGEWDALFARDSEGLLQQRMEQAVDGDYQWYSVASGEQVRQHWVENNPKLAALMNTLTDEEIRCIRRGGHDHKKIFAAFDQAAKQSEKPTVILMKTIKGYGIGRSTEGQNTAHQKKQFDLEERKKIAKKLNIPLNQKQIEQADFYLPESDSIEIKYLRERRHALGGSLPSREASFPTLQAPDKKTLTNIMAESTRPISTTMSFVRILTQLLKDPKLGKYIVPIIPDEARTFGMEGLFSSAGIYSHCGQKYTPVDASSLINYKETKDGQILQEGICETGAMASFLAAGTAYAMHGIPTIPFYIFYSIFGFQRVADMIWACGDTLCKGFLLGGTAGRTTLNGEGLQHQDGHSLLVSSTVPNLLSYDPAFSYELAIIIRNGIKRMYTDKDDIFYYIMLYNQTYPMPAIPKHIDKQDILDGLYCLDSLDKSTKNNSKIQLFGSGAIMTEVLQAQQILNELNIEANIWSVTSYGELYRDILAIEKNERIYLTCKSKTKLQTQLEKFLGENSNLNDHSFVLVTDYMKAVPDQIRAWLPGDISTLGTDGYGLSETRENLRDHFQVDAKHIAYTALVSQYKLGNINQQLINRFLQKHPLK